MTVLWHYEWLMRILKKASGNSNKKMMTQRPLKSYPTWWEGPHPCINHSSIPVIHRVRASWVCVSISHLLRTHVKLLTFPLLGYCLLTLFVYACRYPFINKNALCHGFGCVLFTNMDLKKECLVSPSGYLWQTKVCSDVVCGELLWEGLRVQKTK